MHNVKTKRIMVIDDDIDLLMLLERSLQKEGYDTESAASISEAEEVIEVFQPHLILLDINIKGEDGRKLCWKLKKVDQFKDLIIIVMSGYDYSTGRAVLFGADDLLPKPFHLDFLLHRIDLYLRSKIIKEEEMGLFKKW